MVAKTQTLEGKLKADKAEWEARTTEDKGSSDDSRSAAERMADVVKRICSGIGPQTGQNLAQMNTSIHAQKDNKSSGELDHKGRDEVVAPGIPSSFTDATWYHEHVNNESEETEHTDTSLLDLPLFLADSGVQGEEVDEEAEVPADVEVPVDFDEFIQESAWE